MKNKSVNKLILMIISTALIFILAPFFVNVPLEGASFPLLSSYSTDKTTDSITFLNVGYGDATLVKSNGKHILIDTGNGEDGSISRLLNNMGVTELEAVILTVWKEEHVGGIGDVLDNFTVRKVIMPQISDMSSDDFVIAAATERIIKKSGVAFSALSRGLSVTVGDVVLDFIAYSPDYSIVSERSAVIFAKCRDFKVLMMSDAENLVEESLLKRGLYLKSDVLKVGNHGSKYSSSQKFIEAVDPKHAIISVGYKNDKEHPDKTTCSRINNYGADVLRTDTDGTVKVIFGNEKIEIESERK